jgi:hypothetical protein
VEAEATNAVSIRQIGGDGIKRSNVWNGAVERGVEDGIERNLA